MKTRIDDFISYLKVEKGYSQRTVEEYYLDVKQSLVPFLNRQGIHNVSRVTKNSIQKYLDYLATTKGNCNATRARKLASVKTYFNYLVEAGLLKKNPASSIGSPKIASKQPSYLTESEITKLLGAVSQGARFGYYERDIALITVLLHTGMRVSELTNLKKRDIDIENGYFKIARKGRKEQYLPLNSEATTILSQYLQKRPVSGSEECFIGTDGKGMSRGSVYNIVRRYLRLAGIKKEKHGPHVLRHTFCTRLHRQGVDPFTIRALAGHKDLNTTMRYINIEARQHAAAVEKLVGLS